MPLGWSRGMVVPCLAVQAALEYGCSPPSKSCDPEQGSEPHRALYDIGRLPPVAPTTALWELRGGSVLLFLNLFIF